VDIRLPDDELLGALLVKLFHDRQLTVGKDVLIYLVARMERSFAATSAVVEALDQLALAERRSVTVQLARTVLNELETNSEINGGN
jgi:chromosomal replication initiation ATPase DnaA